MIERFLRHIEGQESQQAAYFVKYVTANIFCLLLHPMSRTVMGFSLKKNARTVAECESAQ